MVRIREHPRDHRQALEQMAELIFRCHTNAAVKLDGLLADLVNFNRRLIENTLVTTRNIELNLIEKGIVRWGAGYLAHSMHPDYKTKDKRGYQPQRVRRPTTIDIPAIQDPEATAPNHPVLRRAEIGSPEIRSPELGNPDLGQPELGDPERRDRDRRDP